MPKKPHRLVKTITYNNYRQYNYLDDLAESWHLHLPRWRLKKTLPTSLSIARLCSWLLTNLTGNGITRCQCQSKHNECHIQPTNFHLMPSGKFVCMCVREWCSFSHSLLPGINTYNISTRNQYSKDYCILTKQNCRNSTTFVVWSWEIILSTFWISPSCLPSEYNGVGMSYCLPPLWWQCSRCCPPVYQHCDYSAVGIFLLSTCIVITIIN